MNVAPPSSPISLEAVAYYPLPGLAIPGKLAFHPDDQLVTYLYSPERSLTRGLYAYDLQTGQERLLVDATGGNKDENVSLAEALRRERTRQMTVGVTQYAWSKKGNRLLIPLRGNIYVQDGISGSLREVLSGDSSPILDPRFSPDGEWVAYVQNAELYVVPAAGGQPRQVTHGARDAGKTHGLAEFIAQEEMRRHHGYWWSPDSRFLAFTEVDEAHIPIYRIVHQGKESVGQGAEEDHRYPFAGQANAHVRLGVISIDGGDPVWMDLEPDDDIYLARVKWASADLLTVQILNREQTRLDLIAYNPHTGYGQTLLQETNEVWINLHHLFQPLKHVAGVPGGGFIWGAERTGFQHLYLYDWDGNLIRPLTSGEWVVDSIAGVDEKQQVVYLMGNRDGPTETHLYVAPLSGGHPRRLTAEPGTHGVILDHGKQRFLDVHHALHTPPTITLRALADGKRLQTIYDQPDPRVAELNLPSPEIVALNSRDGETLYGAIYRPPAHSGDGPFPTIVSVYGGPHSQRVTNSWSLTVDMRAQYLASLGYLVFKLDNRGSGRRGLAFEAPIKYNMGAIEVQDQVDGIRWLTAQGLTDPARVGVYGWSYGGYMAALCLARAADTFQVAVAGAPVTHWDGYDTCYTERYMGTPQANPQGYKVSSVMHHVDKLRGRLLLVHGLIDENVHFRHTARLINALIRARKPYDLLLFPNERHMPRSEADRIYMEERIRDTFLTYL